MCAEFVSYALAQYSAACRRSATSGKGFFLKTFGRVMPVLMTLSVVRAIVYAVVVNAVGNGTNLPLGAWLIQPLWCQRSSSMSQSILPRGVGTGCVEDHAL
jgi:hypothetical protein